ncbi:MAG TPA: ABC transporter ATP-binding protein [Candidatus Dormibacteraeota bacterium]|jgi:ABC-2 type transport system ATP-binding protein|nr:ABC transporter ATP-binding protein [Candidatus Dormibacteraeota bacterium]
MSQASPAVAVHDLVKRYRKAKVNAVDGISLRVETGEFFALLGPNGAGKTTTISILTTTLASTAGHVEICGYNLRRDPAAVRRRVGIIFQNPSLDMNLSGEENVRLHAILYGLYGYRPAYRLMPAAYRRQVNDLASVLDIERDIFKPVRKLSGGMQRKLEIIRGLMHRPQVLFLDEPTAGLDVESRRSLWGYLRQVREQYGVTIVLTTHYLEEAEQADRLCILNHGRIVAMGTPGEIKERREEEYLELDAEDRGRLRTELTQMNLRFDEDAMFTVKLDGRSAHDVIKALDVPLTRLRTRQPSLEDAYLRILADE